MIRSGLARRALRGVALAAASAIALTACTAGPSRDPAVLALGITSEPGDLDPRFGLDDVSQKIHQLLYDGLLVFTDQMQMAPGLAEAFEHPSPTTYVARLRRGVRFHDGRELTAADVAFTYRSLLDPGLGSPRSGGFRELAAVDVLDRYTVRFTLAKVHASFPVNLALGIVPDGSGPELRARPNGTGPYRFERLVADDHVALRSFDGYWNGAPRNGGLLLRVVPDEVMRALELRKGTLDLIVNDVSPDLVQQLREEPSLRAVTAPGVDVQYLGINHRDPVLADLRVRRAIAHAIDRRAIVEYLRRGLAEPANGLLPPQSWAHAPRPDAHPFDPAAARALLDEGGYPDPDGAGPRPRLRLTLKISNLEFNRLQAAVIQEQLRQVGILLDVRSYEFATMFADVMAGNFQLYTLQWTAAALADPDILRRVFHSGQVPPAGFNRGHYRNPALDVLLDAAVQASSARERQALYAAAQQLVADDLPYIHLWHKTNFAVAHRDLTGVRINPYADYLFLTQVTRAPSDPTR